jgi:DNA-binding SARP family transcriptional activator
LSSTAGPGSFHRPPPFLNGSLHPTYPAVRVSPTIHLTLFGTIEIRGPGAAAQLATRPKTFALLSYLLLAQPRGFHRRDRLTGLFWPDQPEAKARGSLRNTLYGLREAMGPDAILTRGDDEVAVDADRVTCDVHEFAAAIARGELAGALELYRGELLSGVYFDVPALDHWLEAERAGYRAAAAEAAWTLAARSETSSDLTSATRWARKAARLAGADERRIRRILTLMARAGDRIGALEVYEEFVRFAARELEAEPSVETQDVARAIRESSRGG